MQKVKKEVEITEISRTFGRPYMSRHELSKVFNMSANAVDARIAELREEIEQGRYSEFAFIKDGGFVFVNTLAWIDFMKHHERLKEKNLRKNVPVFEPRKIAEQIGWYR
ncbi:MAG: hypothetical protein PHX08_01180 [Lachnospiraceae bacterium]|nr:hypothetical protein [Lachnospiraceae bacterium]